ncbi:MAG: glycosyltransferase [Candidatus Pacebacteria bacterium]|nr:glycosyltransferase [Candidatus Paceibacterota bacterium]
MKLLYAAFVRLPTEKAHGQQIMRTVEAFARAGVEVTLVVPSRTSQIHESPFTYYGVEPLFTIQSLSVPDWVRFGPLGFMAALLWFSEVVKWQRAFWDAHYVYSRDAGLLIQYLLLGRKLVYEAHTKPTLVSTIVARCAYRVVVISEGLFEAYRARGVRAEQMIVAHDAVDLDMFATQYDQHAVRAEYGVPDDLPVALYVGKLDEAKGALTLARAASLVRGSWRMVLVGQGPVRDAQHLYPDVQFIGETPYRDLPKVLALADVLVVPNSATDIDASRYTSPLKAFAYLATGKPILASRVPALSVIFKDSATYFEPDNAASLATALQDPHTRTKTIQHTPYTWGERSERIIDHITKV